MKHLLLLLLTLTFLGLGCRNQQTSTIKFVDNPDSVAVPTLPSAREVPLAVFFTVAPDDQVIVNGFRLDINSIDALTAKGCEGGPIGCPDTVNLTVTAGAEKRDVTLAVIGGNRQNASSEEIIFGHRFSLSSVDIDKAIIGVFPVSPPTVPQTSSNPSSTNSY